MDGQPVDAGKWTICERNARRLMLARRFGSASRDDAEIKKSHGYRESHHSTDHAGSFFAVMI